MLWRLHLLPEGVDPDAVVNYCVENNVAGIGWLVDTKPKSPDEYERLAREKYNGRPPSVLFAQEVEIGDFIWIKDTGGSYFLGKVESEWFYDSASQLGIQNQRRCSWRDVGARVPEVVVEAFGLPHQAFRRIVAMV